VEVGEKEGGRTAVVVASEAWKARHAGSQNTELFTVNYQR
jgi:hypothetical protein